MDMCIENVVEFIRDSSDTYVTFSQKRYISKIEKYARERPDECIVLARNDDGTIYAKIPTTWVKISPPRIVSDEARERARNLGRKIKTGSL